MVRVFIGIDVPKDIKAYLISIQDVIKSSGIIAKFIEPENFHISLSFIGEVMKKDIPELIKSVGDVCRGSKVFDAELGNLLLIPDEKSVRVIALSVESEDLDDLRIKIQKRIGGSSHKPHLTLCRVKSIGSTLNCTVVKKIFPVRNVSIYESTLTGKGPVYSRLGEIALT